MKIPMPICHVLTIALFVQVCFVHDSLAQQPSDPSMLNYVVIGAFSVKKNAIRFAKHASGDLKKPVQYQLNPQRNLNYVYSLSTSDLDEAMAEAKRLRDETPLRDAWVYRGSFQLMKPEEEVHTDKIIPREEIQATVVQADTVTTPPTIAQEQDKKVEETVPTVEEKQPPVEDGPGKIFIVKLSRESDKSRIKGSVDAIDTEKARKLKSFESDIQTRLPIVSSKSNLITLVGESFGYRKVQIDLNYENPVSDTLAVSIDAEGRVIVPLEMIRLRKGDFAIMYNVFFFRDAAIMRPESRFEVNNLVEMMRENPKCVIRIHGHTNGNHSGRIIYRGNDVTNFFTIDGSRNAYGSAKELSLARADEIRSYIIAEGVEPNRIQVKAWGGKKAIFDKNSPRAAENVRVEVEIVEDK